MASNFIKKEALAQMLSCEFCEISKNTSFTEHLWVTASEKKWFTYFLINDCFWAIVVMVEMYLFSNFQ